MTKERIDTTKAFYQAWVPIMIHIITISWQLNKKQKKCKTINVIISDKAEILHFVGHIYKSDYFTEEQMTKYEILSDANKVRNKTLAHFTYLFSLCKVDSDGEEANHRFKSAAHICDHSSAHSVITVNTKSASCVTSTCSDNMHWTCLRAYFVLFFHC